MNIVNKSTARNKRIFSNKFIETGIEFIFSHKQISLPIYLNSFFLVFENTCIYFLLFFYNNNTTEYLKLTHVMLPNLQAVCNDIGDK